MSNFSSDVFACAMQLVVPMRREFRKSIDVQNFLYDLTYAKEVLDLAGSSRNEKVKENAEHLGRMVFGAAGSRSPLAEQRPTVGEQSKHRLGIGEVGAAGNPGALISHSAESEKEPRLRVEPIGKYSAGVR